MMEKIRSVCYVGSISAAVAAIPLGTYALSQALYNSHTEEISNSYQRVACIALGAFLIGATNALWINRSRRRNNNKDITTEVTQ